jgi:hypothetical protein
VWLITEIKLGGDNLRSCINCKGFIKDGELYCKHCGYELNQIPKSAYICRKCEKDLLDINSVCECRGKAILRDEYNGFVNKVEKRRRLIIITSILVILIVVYMIITWPKSIKDLTGFHEYSDVSIAMYINTPRLENGQPVIDYITANVEGIDANELMHLLHQGKYKPNLIKTIFSNGVDTDNITYVIGINIVSQEPKMEFLTISSNGTVWCNDVYYTLETKDSGKLIGKIHEFISMRQK